MSQYEIFTRLLLLTSVQANLYFSELLHCGDLHPKNVSLCGETCSLVPRVCVKYSLFLLATSSPSWYSFSISCCLRTRSKKCMRGTHAKHKHKHKIIFTRQRKMVWRNGIWNFLPLNTTCSQSLWFWREFCVCVLVSFCVWVSLCYVLYFYTLARARDTR